MGGVQYPSYPALKLRLRVQVFQCLLIDGENAGASALRDAERYVVSDEQFREFVARHRALGCLVPESNVAMRHSYLILDEYVSSSGCQTGEWALVQEEKFH